MIKIASAFVLLAGANVVTQYQDMPQNYDVSAENFIKHVPAMSAPAVCTCPTSYERFDTQCSRIIETAPRTICKDGGVLYNNECIRSVKPETKCPYGYVYSERECVKRTQAIQELSCPTGFDLQRVAIKEKRPLLLDSTLLCSRKVEVSLIQECPDGSKYRGSCFSDQNVQPQLTCKPGFSLDDGLCKKSEKIQCQNHNVRSSLLHDLATPIEAVLSNHLNGKHLRALEGIHYPLTAPVADEVVSIDSECFQHVTLQPGLFCSVGKLQGKYCKVSTRVQPLKVCPAYGDIDDCYTYERVSPVSTCPLGYKQQCLTSRNKYNIKCECVKTYTQPLNIYCPIGFDLQGSECVARSPSTTTCDNGESSVNGYCQRLETIPAKCYFTYQTSPITARAAPVKLDSKHLTHLTNMPHAHAVSEFRNEHYLHHANYHMMPRLSLDGDEDSFLESSEAEASQELSASDEV